MNIGKAIIRIQELYNFKIGDIVEIVEVYNEEGNNRRDIYLGIKLEVEYIDACIYSSCKNEVCRKTHREKIITGRVIEDKIYGLEGKRICSCYCYMKKIIDKE